MQYPLFTKQITFQSVLSLNLWIPLNHPFKLHIYAIWSIDKHLLKLAFLVHYLKFCLLQKIIFYLL